MSKFPSLPLFTDSYIADTKHLTTEEHGAYLQLLMYAWRTKGCRLQNDDKFLARTLGVSMAKWLRLKPSVMAFWTLVGGFWTQKRLAKEYAFVADRSKKRRAAGVLGGRPKSLKDNDTSKAKGSQEKSKSKAPNPNPNPTDPPKAPKGAEPEGFAEFRAAYPKRNTSFPTTDARKRWVQAVQRGAKPQDIIAGAKAYAAEQQRIGKTGTEFVKTADVWLNRGLWQDFTAAPPVAAVPPAPVPDETWRERVREWKIRCGYWPWRQSQPPDHPRTLVPPHILAEFGLGPEAGPAEPLRKTGTGR